MRAIVSAVNRSRRALSSKSKANSTPFTSNGPLLRPHPKHGSDGGVTLPQRFDARAANQRRPLPRTAPADMGSGQAAASRFRKCRVPKPHPTFP